MEYQISRSRVHDCVRNVDPTNTAFRWQGNITARRPYTVPGPNSLWHRRRIKFQSGGGGSNCVVDL